jgi:hypothetical protein
MDRKQKIKALQEITNRKMSVEEFKKIFSEDVTGSFDLAKLTADELKKLLELKSKFSGQPGNKIENSFTETELDFLKNIYLKAVIKVENPMQNTHHK